MRGLSVPPWVKTSLAPGSPAARRVLERAGVLAPLEALGFAIVNDGISGAVHRDRTLLTGDSPMAGNALGKLAAETLLANVAG